MTILEREARVFFHTYKRIPLEVDRGEGVYLYGKDGQRYLDLFGGLAVNALGYNHPRVIEAIDRQIRRYIHLSNYYLQDTQIELAERLVNASGYSKVFLSNSGTEAIEGALKIARKWGKDRSKSVVVSFTNAFHGRTMGALSMMDREKYRNGFEPFLPGFVSIPFNDVQALRRAVNKETLAVVLEFIQGEGGINVVTEEFVSELQRLRQQFDFLLVADEIQSGLGRTGKFFAFQHYTTPGGIQPDIVVVAKPLGGGLPLGAILGSEKVTDALQYGVHGTTFGGNPVACAAGIVVLDELVNKGLTRHVAEVGDYFIGRLRDVQQEFRRLIAGVRGKGLMVGMELTRGGDAVVEKMREEGVLINCTNQTVLRFLPPLTITRDELDEGLHALRKVLKALN